VTLMLSGLCLCLILGLASPRSGLRQHSLVVAVAVGMTCLYYVFAGRFM
jgi:hypothetical protein